VVWLLSIGATLAAGCQVRGQGLAVDSPDGGGAGAGGMAVDASGGRGGAGDAAQPPRDATARGGSEGGTVAADTAPPAADRPIDTARPPDAPVIRDAAVLPRDAPPDLFVGPEAGPERMPPAALMLVGSASLEAGEQAAQGRLVTLGFRVMVMPVTSDEQVAAARRAAMAHQLVFMSSSLPGGIGLPNALRDVAVPLICARPTSFDNIGFNDDNSNGFTNSQSQIAVTGVGHPLAAGQLGVVTVVTQPTVFGWSQQPVPGATRIATLVGQPDRVAILAFEKGAATRFGPAPARRVGLFALESVIERFNGTGWALFDAAVRWVTGS
jgi:hypothetical protein